MNLERHLEESGPLRSARLVALTYVCFHACFMSVPIDITMSDDVEDLLRKSSVKKQLSHCSLCDNRNQQQLQSQASKAGLCGTFRRGCGSTIALTSYSIRSPVASSVPASSRFFQSSPESRVLAPVSHNHDPKHSSCDLKDIRLTQKDGNWRCVRFLAGMSLHGVPLKYEASNMVKAKIVLMPSLKFT
uniref:Uncharacterized protein n=1 Tax=Steinernema glaseri TaxID=37863 RepID=A0A1I8AFH4_9BILA